MQVLVNMLIKITGKTTGRAALGFAGSVVLAVYVLLLPACGYNDFNSYAPPAAVPLVPNTDIAELQYYYGTGSKKVYDDVIISGYVTANDKSGNFYRVFMLEDHTGGIEVKAGIDRLHNNYAVGAQVSVKARGLNIGSYNGVLEIGLEPEPGSIYETDYFGHKMVLDKYAVLSGGYNKPVPEQYSIHELDEKLCGRLVRINGLKFVKNGLIGSDEDITWAVPKSVPGSNPETGYRVFEDHGGETVAVVTSGYAGFAGEVIPSSMVSLTGILSFGKTDTGSKTFMLKLRDIDDVEIP